MACGSLRPLFDAAIGTVFVDCAGRSITVWADCICPDQMLNAPPAVGWRQAHALRICCGDSSAFSCSRGEDRLVHAVQPPRHRTVLAAFCHYAPNASMVTLKSRNQLQALPAGKRKSANLFRVRAAMLRACSDALSHCTRPPSAKPMASISPRRCVSRGGSSPRSPAGYTPCCHSRSRRPPAVRYLHDRMVANRRRRVVARRHDHRLAEAWVKRSEISHIMAPEARR